jgi:16S rRNA (guanine527-N7)-methyltransferase
MADQSIRNAADFRATFKVSAETVARLGTYEELLKQWQNAVNLVAPSTLDHIWHRHFADSAQLVRLAPRETRSWIDIGSGGGFPGLVCAIMLADAAPPSPRREGWREAPGGGIGGAPSSETPTPDPSLQGGGESIHFTLIESDTRKAAFLREVARSVGPLPGITVEILSKRAESVTTEVNSSLLPRVICARALAPLDRLFALALPLSPPGTTGVWCKGKEVERELEAARKNWNFDVALVPSVTDPDGRIAVTTNLDRKAKD